MVRFIVDDKEIEVDINNDQEQSEIEKLEDRINSGSVIGFDIKD